MSIDSASSFLQTEIILEKIAEITLHIQQGRELEDILQWTIADARALLQTDRVLISRFLENQDAVVAFESVGADWTPILGQLIYDPCFSATWVEYKQGQTTTLSDTHSGTIDPGYVQLLKGLQVQANLVVPIFNQGTLWGLLIAHHCRSPRAWQPLEVQLLQHIALQLGVATQQAELRQRQQYLESQLEQHTVDRQQSTIALTDPNGDISGFIGTVADLNDRQRKEDLIQDIAQGVSAKTGEAFFHSLVQYLTRLLGMDQAFVFELITPETKRVKIIAGLSDDQVLDGLECPLVGTPCEQVFEQGFCIYPNNVQQLFPEALALKALGGESYVGIPLVSSSGAVIGSICVISNQAIANVQFIQEVLTIFAVRAASELERRQSEAILRRYERIVSATPDMVSLIDRNYLYQVVNQSYLTWNQKTYDQIVGHSVSDLLGQELFETVQPLMDRCLAGELQQILETWQNYPDGQRRYIRATYSPYLELDGTISGVVVNVHDLTDLKLVEEALRESEERFRQMATSIHEVFWLTDINSTQTIYVSPIYEEIWGRSCASLYEQPRSFLEPIHPDDRAHVLDTLEQRPQTGFNHEYRLVRPDGTIRWIWERAFPVADTTGHPYRLVGVSQDITDRKAVETALKESQQHYQNLIENSPDIIERFDPQLRHLFVSSALTKLTGIATESFIGKTCRDLGMDAAMVNTWEAAAGSLLSTGQKQIIEFELPTLNGLRSFEMAIAPELSDQQTIESILCISRDVTDRKASEIALREQQQFTEQIAQSTLAILYVYDLIEQRNIYTNQQVEKVLGYSPEEIQAMGDALFSLLAHPDDLPRMMAGQQRLLTVQNDEFVETEYRMRHKTGSYRWLLSRDRIFNRTAEGLPTQSLGVATDITILKETQVALYQQAERQRLLMAVAQRIRQTLDLHDILGTTVTEVRQFLQTDRVVIYRFEPDGSGIVIAESVTEGWRSILGMQITASYFVEIQGQLYEQDRVKATDDIYTANLDPYPVSLLEQMQVRARLMMPILQDNQLWGLLVAQHCRSPRQWEASEIELQQQLATQIAIAIQQAALYQQSQQELAERQRAETALQQLNQELEQRVQERTQSLHQRAEQERLLRLIIQNIHRSLDLEETLAAVLSETRQTLRADRVAVYQLNPDWSGSFVAESVGAGWVPLVLPGIQKVWQDTYLHDTQGGRYQNNETLAVNDIYTIGHHPCHIDLLEQFQARAYVLAPIFLDDQLWGLLAVYQNSSPREWQGWEISLIRQIGIQTAIALRQSYLYQAAQAQVKELERLSQLKDDFLSTVSHELRSPMSSVKMATQMLEITLQDLGVLDDESNAINRYFKILEEEGQREVNLINDLLDLARLDAGTDPLNLTTIALQFYIPHLAESFVERTHQQQQQLAIQIPDDLPDFITDLPYLGRILTELLHNACKYTPPGETITVSVQLAASALEICVSNAGVEIPAAECDRIFDKFYRIPNSDPWKHGGTGLGLALVKKLTERLGGHIHVESDCGQTTFILEFGLFT
ncbi:GAF domain-containing protein [Phormidesmis priestleyi]|uniref:GAF domain-containing protein n=1 Tax=Phormidesmis priestleyi TaxID=268141 RepID=UPI000934EC23|nr:GAF domain-containing protein [Phormidesmis priestleyi]